MPFPSFSPNPTINLSPTAGGSLGSPSFPSVNPTPSSASPMAGTYMSGAQAAGYGVRQAAGTVARGGAVGLASLGAFAGGFAIGNEIRRAGLRAGILPDDFRYPGEQIDRANGEPGTQVEQLGAPPFTGGQSAGVTYEVTYDCQWRATSHPEYGLRRYQGVYSSQGPVSYPVYIHDKEISGGTFRGWEALYITTSTPGNEYPTDFKINTFTVRRADGQSDTGGNQAGLSSGQYSAPSTSSGGTSPSPNNYQPARNPETGTPANAPTTLPSGIPGLLPGIAIPAGQLAPRNGSGPLDFKPGDNVNPLGSPLPGRDPNYKPPTPPPPTPPDSPCSGNRCAQAQMDMLGKLDGKLDGVNAGLGAANQALLQAMDAKLGAQLPNGGLAGFLGRMSQSNAIDRAINLLNLYLAIVQIQQLSTSLLQTVYSGIDTFLNAFGLQLKDSEGNAVGTGELIKNTIGTFLVQLVGTETAETLQSTFVKYNRIYQAVHSGVQNLANITNPIRAYSEQAATGIGKLHNRLQTDGTLSERWGKLTEKVGPYNALDRVSEALQNVESGVSFATQIASDTVSIRESMNALKQDRVNLEAAQKVDTDALTALRASERADSKAPATLDSFTLGKVESPEPPPAANP